MKKIRLGVIGADSGIAKEYHLPALAKCEGVVFETACDINLEGLEVIKKQYGFNKITTDYKEILSDPEIDAVVILTKVDLHAEMSIAAAKAKKDIFMQKAIGLSLEEAQEIIDTAREEGVKLTISFMHRYFDESIKAHDIIQEGTLGDLQFVRMRNSVKNPESVIASYGGCIMDIGSHGMDLIRYLFGQEVKRVKSMFHQGSGIGTSGWNSNLNGDELFAFLLYELEDGTKVIHEILWSHIAKTDRFEVEISGRRGSLLVRNTLTGAKLHLGIAENGVENGIEWSSPEVEESFFGQYQHQLFIDDLRFGKNESATGEDGFAPLAILEAARRSMESGNWEEPFKVKK
ncbi:MAG: Gfo/Idh/MocA family protein [Saccharofermentanales bacterium]|jgi:UDP-N-acetylglucosamine 3-dehydrogenase